MVNPSRLFTCKLLELGRCHYSADCIASCGRTYTWTGAYRILAESRWTPRRRGHNCHSFLGVMLPQNWPSQARNHSVPISVGSGCASVSGASSESSQFITSTLRYLTADPKRFLLNPKALSLSSFFIFARLIPSISLTSCCVMRRGTTTGTNVPLVERCFSCASSSRYSAIVITSVSISGLRIFPISVAVRGLRIGGMC